MRRIPLWGLFLAALAALSETLAGPLFAQPSGPVIQAAGYLSTEITGVIGGQVSIWALAPGIGPTGHVWLYYQGLSTGVEVPVIDPSNLFSTTIPLTPGLPAGRFLLELKAEEGGDFAEAAWPYLNVVRDPVVTEMVAISEGEFTTGSPLNELCRYENETRHRVILTRPFFLQNTEVTVGQWESLFGSSPAGGTACGDECPVDYATWFDAIVFCNRLSGQEGFRPAYFQDPDFNRVFDGTPPVSQGSVFWDRNAEGYRLPTEAEWEFASRAGTTGTFAFPCDSFGFLACVCDISCVSKFAWYCGNSDNTAHFVGQLAGNGFGLYDMSGNVWEWCWDWYAAYPTAPELDPSGPSTGRERVIKGGSYATMASYCRSGVRFYGLPEASVKCVGFRIARTP